jgi:DNA-binding XRE family transcriptional regulator
MKITRGKVLAFKRKRAGVSQKALAAKLGWTDSALCKVERGRFEKDNAKHSAALAALEEMVDCSTKTCIPETCEVGDGRIGANSLGRNQMRAGPGIGFGWDEPSGKFYFKDCVVSMDGRIESSVGENINRSG